MRKTVVSAALLMLMSGMGAAEAQGSGDLRGPREMPPASFKGQQYVDSRGCVFLRAGLSGTVNWVPRVSRDRKQLCGQLPSFGANQVAVDDSPLVDKAAPKAGKAAAAAGQTQTAATTSAATPAAKTQSAATRAGGAAPPANTKAAAAASSANATSAGLVGVAPGNTKAGTLAAAPPPKTKPAAAAPSPAPAPTVVSRPRPLETVASLSAPPKIVPAPSVAPRVVKSYAAPAPSNPRAVVQQAAPVQETFKPPSGYKFAHTDDRLNPLSGVGSALGNAEQQQVWTQEVPARLVTHSAGPRPSPVAVEQSSRPSDAPLTRQIAPQHSTMPVAAAPSQRMGRYVQVGSFGQASNVTRATSKLQALGLPVAQSQIRKRGKALQVVMAGPFGSAAEAQVALRQARAAGFSDAYLR